MSNEPIEENDMPAEIDFSKGVHGLHHIPSDAKLLMPASSGRTVWEYFSGNRSSLPCRNESLPWAHSASAMPRSALAN